MNKKHTILEQWKLIHELKNESKTCYGRATKTEIRNKILTLGIVKPCQANFLIKNLLGDQSAASDDSQSNIFHRLNIAINIRIWKYIYTTFFVFENGTFFIFGNGTFSYLKKRHFLYLKMIHFRIWKWHILLSWKCWIFVFERDTFLYLQLAHFSYLKLPHFSYLKTAHFVFAIDTFFVFESSTFRISKLHISFLIIRRLLDKVTWEMTTFEMLTLFRMDIFGVALSHISYNDETWHSCTLPKEDPENIWITRQTCLLLLTSAFFQRKSANFVISRNTDMDCILVHNF